MSPLAWIIVIVLLVVFVPVLFSVLRKRDYDRQVAGKRPVREYDKNRPIPEKKAFNADAEAEKTIARMKSGQNMMGPH